MTKHTKQVLHGKQAQLFITDVCNLRCTGCPYPAIPRARKTKLRSQEIKPGRWREITDYLHKQGVKLFCVIGGEPASYEGVDKVINNITRHPDAFVMFSTSGIHLLQNKSLRKKVGEALASPTGRKLKNSIVISFDALPNKMISDSRGAKAKMGLACIQTLQKEFGDNLTYAANVMIYPGNIDEIPEIQEYLETRKILANFCTQQTKCFKGKPVFDATHLEKLTKIAIHLIKRKSEGGPVVNSVNYLSQLPQAIAQEEYKCWQETGGSPVLDFASDGNFLYCNWIGQNTRKKLPGVNTKKLIEGEITWAEVWEKSKEITKSMCKGCSWSRRDRSPKPMVPFNKSLVSDKRLPKFNRSAPALQNIWALVQS